MSNQRVAYIVSMRHGLDRWTFTELDALAREGFEIAIYPIRYGMGPYMPRPGWICYRYKRWLVVLRQAEWLIRNPRRYLRLLLEGFRTHTLIDALLGCDFAHHMANQRCAMIHCVYGDHKLFIGYYCHKLLNLPLSVALYGHDLRDNPNWSMLRQALSVCDEIIVNCDFNRRLLAEIAGDATAQRATVIRHYAEIPASGAQDQLKLLILGGFHVRKGHDVLFKAIKQLGAEANKLQVWVAGYQGDVDVQQLARDLGVAEHVRVFGAVPDAIVNLLLEQCDIFCLPSRPDANGVSEGLPVALIEAMAHAKPVITTSLGGIPELVDETLIEAEDVAGLAHAIERLVNDPELRQKQGLHNRQIVEERYSPQNADYVRNLFVRMFHDEEQTKGVVLS